MIIGDVLSFGGSGVLPKINVSGLLSTDSVVATMGSKTKTAKWKTRQGLVGLVPTMTSNTTPSGEVISNFPSPSSATQYYAFDKDNSTKVYVNAQYPQTYIGYIFTEAKVIKKYSIQASPDGYLAKTITLQASNDGNSWTDLHTNTFSSITASQVYEFDITNSTAYTRYRVYFNEAWSGTGGYWAQTSEVQFYGYGEVGYWSIDIDSFGLWNVTATDSGVTKHLNVMVDTVREYDVDISDFS